MKSNNTFQSPPSRYISTSSTRKEKPRNKHSRKIWSFRKHLRELRLIQGAFLFTTFPKATLQTSVSEFNEQKSTQGYRQAECKWIHRYWRLWGRKILHFPTVFWAFFLSSNIGAKWGTESPSQLLERTNLADTTWAQTPHLQNWETIHFCHVSRSICATMLRQPQEAKTFPQHIKSSWALQSWCL